MFWRVMTVTELQTLKDENQRWHQQHADWLNEAQKWQRETHRLSALLYLLDKALPEHSAMLNKHIALINKHEEMVNCYECGIEPQCFDTCDSYKTEHEQHVFHETLCQLHGEAESEHEKLKQMFIDEMERFRTLAKELLQQAKLD